MANTRSAKKRARQSLVKAQINKSRIGRIRTFIRKVEDALLLKNKEQAASAFKCAEPEIMKGVTKGVLHKNTASRYVSRLAKRVNTLQA